MRAVLAATAFLYLLVGSATRSARPCVWTENAERENHSVDLPHQPLQADCLPLLKRGRSRPAMAA